MCSRDELVGKNIGLVHSCAGRFCGRGTEYDDLFQAGCVGLIKASDNFDEKLGYQFSTYAVPVIMGEIKRLFRDGGAVKVSRSVKELWLRVNRAREKFILTNGREPAISELASILDVLPEQITEALCASQPPVSLTAESDDGEIQTDIPTDAPDKRLTEMLSLREELERLPKEDRLLIRMRFFSRKTQSQTAKALGMTQVQVSRRERRLLSELRKKLA